MFVVFSRNQIFAQSIICTEMRVCKEGRIYIDEWLLPIYQTLSRQFQVVQAKRQ